MIIMTGIVLLFIYFCVSSILDGCWFSISHNGLGITEGRGFLAQKLNRITAVEPCTNVQSKPFSPAFGNTLLCVCFFVCNSMKFNFHNSYCSIWKKSIRKSLKLLHCLSNLLSNRFFKFAPSTSTTLSFALLYNR